jgi:hypothetical protein
VEEKWASARRKVGEAEAKLPATIIGPYVLPGPVVAKGGEAVPVGEEFFDKAGLKAEAVARWINRGDLAIGVDGTLWSYDGGAWRPDRNVVTARGSALLRDRWRHSLRADDRGPGAGVAGHLPARFGGARRLVNVRNGMLDWATGVLKPHDPTFLSTTQLPVEWDPAARVRGSTVGGSGGAAMGVVPRLWEVVGYMLLPGNELQKAVLLYGPGGNGKGTLIRVLKHLIGSWNCSS